MRFYQKVSKIQKYKVNLKRYLLVRKCILKKQWRLKKFQQGNRCGFMKIDRQTVQSNLSKMKSKILNMYFFTSPEGSEGKLQKFYKKSISIPKISF